MAEPPEILDKAIGGLLRGFKMCCEENLQEAVEEPEDEHHPEAVGEAGEEGEEEGGL